VAAVWIRHPQSLQNGGSGVDTTPTVTTKWWQRC